MSVRDAHPVDPDGVARASERALSAVDADRATAVHGVLADSLAVRIVTALSHGDGHSAAELTTILGALFPDVVSALRCLEERGVVVRIRDDGVTLFRVARPGYATIVTLAVGSLQGHPR